MTNLIASNNSPVAKYLVRLTHTWANGEVQQNTYAADTIKEVRNLLVSNTEMAKRGGCTVRNCVSSYFTIANVPAAMIKTQCARRGSFLAAKTFKGGFSTTLTVELQR